uniref:Pol protein, putative n=1 Tax=Asparagus officinalis TaxID=4686 RepID=Q2AA17_ASPOF|nr:pol protein, putative [Asparagus officinalis]
MAPYEALYGRPYRSPICWAEPKDSLMLGPELVGQTTEKVGDAVMLKVSPMKGVQRFGRRGKLVPRYIRPFRILECIGAVSYRLDLPASMSSIHNVFHISILKKHLHDEEQQGVLDAPEIELQEALTTIKIPVCILAREEKRLRNKSYVNPGASQEGYYLREDRSPPAHDVGRVRRRGTCTIIFAIQSNSETHDEGYGL